MLDIDGIIFQILMLLVLIVPTFVIVFLILTLKKKNQRLNNIEDKLDKLLSEKEKK